MVSSIHILDKQPLVVKTPVVMTGLVGAIHINVDHVYSDYELINGQWNELPPF